MTPVKFKRGETFSRILLVRAGDADGAEVRCVLKRSRNGKAPGDAAEDAAVFDMAWLEHHDPADEASAPGWLATLSPEQTEALTPGLYATDARVSIDGAVVATQTEQVEVVERVTEPAGG